LDRNWHASTARSGASGDRQCPDLPLADGSEHLHWWLVARPARFEQLRTNLVLVWDDVLPPVPQEIWHADVDRLRAALAD
jgi:hypothetical protein